MKVRDKAFLISCSLAPLVGFFPVEIHYGLMRILEFAGFSERSQTVSIQAQGASYHLLVFLSNWLSTLTAVIFAIGALRLRLIIRNRSKVDSFSLTMLLFFAGATVHFLIPHLIAFFFTIVMLAILANIREEWVEAYAPSISESEPNK